MTQKMWLITKFSKVYFILNVAWLFTYLLLPSILVPLSDALIVPKELPSILSVVYSNIPPIKKGTDSRLGFGFRLGEHADFQVVVEMGPQIETRPLGNQEQTNSFNKRQVNLKDQSKIIQEEERDEKISAPLTIVNRKDNWLEKWKGDVQKLKSTEQDRPGESMKLPTKPYVPEETLRQLQLLYKMATSTMTNPITTTATATATTATITTTTIKEEATAEPIESDGFEDFTVDTMTMPIELQDTLKFLKVKYENNDLQELQESYLKTKSEITKELMDVSLNE